MKLADHVSHLRVLIEASFNKHFSGLGIGKTKQLDIENIPEEMRSKRKHYESILAVLKTLAFSYGTYKAALIAVSAYEAVLAKNEGIRTTIIEAKI